MLLDDIAYYFKLKSFRSYFILLYQGFEVEVNGRSYFGFSDYKVLPDGREYDFIALTKHNNNALPIMKMAITKVALIRRCVFNNDNKTIQDT